MDYLIEAKKFVQRAFDASNPDVIKEHLKIADWCLCQEIEERDDAFSRGLTKKQKGRQILLDSGTVLRPKVGTAYHCGFRIIS